MIDHFGVCCADMDHRKSFSELTEAQIHPATSVSAPEGFLTHQQEESNPNGNYTAHMNNSAMGEIIIRFVFIWLPSRLWPDKKVQRTKKKA